MNQHLPPIIEILPNQIGQRFHEINPRHIAFVPASATELPIALITNDLSYTLILNMWFQITCTDMNLSAYIQWALSGSCRVAIHPNGELCRQSLQYFSQGIWHEKEQIKILDFTLHQKTHTYYLTNQVTEIEAVTMNQLFPSFSTYTNV